MKKISAFIMAAICLMSCNLTLQNINTHGTATDLVDENQSADPEVSPTLSIPVKPAM